MLNYFTKILIFKALFISELLGEVVVKFLFPFCNALLLRRYLRIFDTYDFNQTKFLYEPDKILAPLVCAFLYTNS